MLHVPKLILSEPLLRGSMPVHRASIHLNAIARRCFAALCVAIATLCGSLLFLGYAMLCHCVSVASLRQSPLFHCVAEIRIAPQSLRCSSRSKTELSLPYAVLGRAALHLSVAMHGCSSHFLCCARLNQALPLLCFSTLCRSFAVLSSAEQC